MINDWCALCFPLEKTPQFSNSACEKSSPDAILSQSKAICLLNKYLWRACHMCLKTWWVSECVDSGEIGVFFLSPKNYKFFLSVCVCVREVGFVQNGLKWHHFQAFPTFWTRENYYITIIVVHVWQCSSVLVTAKREISFHCQRIQGSSFAILSWGWDSSFFITLLIKLILQEGDGITLSKVTREDRIDDDGLGFMHPWLILANQTGRLVPLTALNVFWISYTNCMNEGRRLHVFAESSDAEHHDSPVEVTESCNTHLRIKAQTTENKVLKK